MKNLQGKIAGILGTVIIHLLAAILFMSFQISELKREIKNEFEIELMPITEEEAAEKIIELPASTIERVLQGDEEMLNIARNLANRSEEVIDPEKYIDMVKEEMIQKGLLGADNYIDEWKRLKETSPDDNLEFSEDKNELNGDDQPDRSEVMAANYKGPTRIFYDMEGRNHVYLPVPIYKCIGAGTVVLHIEINQKGVVENARIIEAESTTSDQCLVETAVTTALISRFNSDINAPKIQTGTLTYIFVAQ